MIPGPPQPSLAEHDALRAARSLPPLGIPDHTLVQLIGRGSYGEVWLARNVIGTLRAVKIVYRQAFDHDRPYEREFMGIQRFEPLSRTHEGLVDILQVGRNDLGGYFYYVMEVADDGNGRSDGKAQPGQCSLTPALQHSSSYAPRSLAHEIDRRGALPVDECIGLALSLASAVAHLHKQGLIHRDIKPANIIFVGGAPKLADIGLVSEVGDSRSYVGTEGYIPPEGPGTRQADLYSLGKLIYEASTGRDRTAFPALPVELTRGESGGRFLELNAVFVKACAQDAQQRYQSAAELQADLALLQSGKSVRHLRTVERRLRVATRIGAGALLLAALAFGAFGFARRQARLERENFVRLERAEREARQQLWESLVAQSRASRRTGEGGQRFDALEAIAKAASIETPPMPRAQALYQLRNEAIACLALADLRVVQASFASSHPLSSVDAAFERYAVGDGQGGVQIRRISDDGLLLELPRLSIAVQRVYHFSPKGRFLLVLYRDGLMRVWDLSRKEAVLSVRPEEDVRSIDFSPDEQRMVAVSPNRLTHLYDLPSGKLVKQEPTNVDWLRLRFSPDGGQVGGISQTRSAAQLVSVDTGQVMAEMPHRRGVFELAWSPDGKQVATACTDSKVYLWKPTEREPEAVLSGHQASATEVAFHRNGWLLASTGWDGTTRLWDSASGELLVTLPVGIGMLRFSHDGRRLTGYVNNQRLLTVFEVAGNPVCRLLGGAVLMRPGRSDWTGAQRCVAFSPDGRWLASAHVDGVRLWDTVNGRAVANLSCGQTDSVFFSPDGQTVFASGAEGVLSWPLDGVIHSGDKTPQPARLSSHKGCSRACLGADGREVAYTRDRQVHLLHAKHQFAAPAGVCFIAASSNGRWLTASAWYGGGGRLWDLASGRAVRDFATGQSVDVSFSPDSRWLITAEAEQYRFWDTESGQLGHRIVRQGITGVPVSVAFSRDGKTFACAWSKTVVKLLHAETLEELGLLEAPHSQMISWLAFNPAGTQLAVGTSTSTIQLWDLAALRQELARLHLDW
jgi:WD40 repeat protein